MRSLRELTLMRLREFYREPSALFWTYGFPILLAVALGVAFRSEARPVAEVAVLEGPRQAERLAVLGADPSLRVRGVTAAEAEALFRGGRIVLAVTGDETPAYRFDPTHPEAEVARHRVDARLQAAAGRFGGVATEDEPVRAPGTRYIDFLIPGLVGMNVMSGSMWGIGWTLADARRRKLLKRLAATPMRRWEFVASFLLARLVFLITEVAAIFALAVWAFGVQVQGSWLLVAALSVAGALAFAGLGLLCAARTENTETVSGLMNLVMLPMFVFSGVFFASTRFPEWMQPFIAWLPLSTLNDALRAVMNEGAGGWAAWGAVGILAAWGVAGSAAALRFFRWS